ncbi:MAG: CAP domain-containing protein [Acidimicrobiales bacterium]
MRTREHRTFASIVIVFLLLVGCGESDSAGLPSTKADPLSVDGSDVSATGLDTSSTAPSSSRTASSPSTTNQRSTSSSVDVARPPTTSVGASVSAPTTRPPATPAPPPPTTPATAAQTAPTTPGSAAAAPTTAAPTPATPSPATGAPAGVVEFRIPAGTGVGPWNSYDTRVRVSVGQILRIYNDDSVSHTVHSTGVPFEHGRSIRPGEFADHPILQPLSPNRSAPANYEHAVGASAAFWVEAGALEQSASAGGKLAAAEAESLRLLNGLRADLGVQLVTPSDQEMHAFARDWSLEMRRTGFRHSSPPRWFENIVWYSDETMTPAEAAAQFHAMWVDSPGHYDNMTNPEWSIVGVGMWHDESGWWGVHVFR